MTNIFLTEGEREQLLFGWNDTELPFPRDRTVVDLFDARVRERPGAVAVVADDATLSYAELDRRARVLTATLVDLGAGPTRRVVLYLERSSAIPVAVLAVWRAGAAYVPLDAERAGNRLAAALADDGVCAVVTGGALQDRVPPGDVPVVCVDATTSHDAVPPAGPVPVDAAVPRPDATACVVYTSGSTGRPKGVLITHANLAGLYHAWDHAYELSTLRAHGQLTSFSFVVFQADLVRALCSGATLVIFPTETVLDPARLHGELLRTGVDFVEFVPALLRALLRHCAEVGRPIDFLRLLVVGSDRWLYGEHAQLQRDVGATTRVVHSFGLTETTVDSTYFTGTTADVAHGRLTPIGRPFPNVQTYALDADMEPVPVGTTGELYVGGVGVAEGYLGDPELTTQRFVPDPFGPPGARLYRTGDLVRHLVDGNLQFLGRADGLVKIRGFRVELGEVEMALRRHPGVADAAVVAVGQGAETALAAYVVPDRPTLDDGGARRLVDLPNGMSVASVNHAETHQFFQELFVDRMYLRHGVGVQDGDVVFDVGANIGMFALCVAAAAKVSVFAFEPSLEVFEALSLNVNLHGVHATLFHCGLSSRVQRGSLTYYPASTGMSSLYGDAEEERAVLGTIIANQFVGASEGVGDWIAERLHSESRDCELRTLSEVIDRSTVDRIDLLKIVVQKSEWDVLDGVRAEHWPRIGQLVIETYDIDGRVAAVLDRLTALGYAVTVDQAPLFVGSDVHLVYAVRPGWRDQRAVAEVAAPAPVAPLSVRGLHRYLREQLADYLVPTRLALLERLPLTVTGKVDRAALPAAELVDMSVAAVYVAPRTATERDLVEVWTDVLSVERVGVLDDFFHLGGHSLLATQVTGRIRARWGVDVPLRVFLRDRTVANLAVEVDRLRTQGTSPAAAAIPRLDRAAYRRARPDAGQ